jgi:hypothetical protein
LFILTPFVDAILWTVLSCTSIILTWSSRPTVLNWSSGGLAAVVILAFVGHIALYVDRDARRLDWETLYSGGLSWLYAVAETVIGRITPAMLAISAVLCRLYMAGFIFLWAFVWELKRPLLIPLVAIFAIFVAFWGVAANRADRILKRPSIGGMIALPLLWLRQNARKGAKRIDLKAIDLYAILGVIGGIILIGAFMAVVIVGFVFLTDHVSSWIVYGGCAVIFASGALFSIYLGLRRQWNDRQLLRKTERGSMPCNGFAEMLDVLGLFRTKRGLLLFVQYVKRQRIPVHYPESLRALQVFTAIAQGDKVSAYSLPVPGLEPNELEEIDHWTNNIQASSSDLTIDQTIIDEISKIVADIELPKISG